VRKSEQLKSVGEWGTLKVLAAVLVVIAVATPSAGLAEQPIQVFVLAGQSNMVGRALPVSAGTGAVDNLLLYRGGEWQPASDPLGPQNDPERGVGPGMTFGIGVLAHEPPGTTVGLVMCARGATSITSWQRGSLGACKRMVRAAGGTVAGVVFLQGEYEARYGAQNWQMNFERVEAGFEQSFGRVPFVLGQIGNIARPYAQEVRDFQAAADAEFPPVTLVSSIDLPLLSDGVHFTVDAAKTLGYRYANAWWSLLQEFPHVTDVSPGEGLPGTAVIITGSAFSDASSVTFDKAGASFTVDSPEQITAIVPDGGRTGPVSVTTPYATNAGPSFTVVPVVDSFTPVSGSPGTRVFVSGKALAGTTAASLNGQSVRFKVLSATQVRITVPGGATSGKIDITTAGGTAESPGDFTVTG
jgi:hypothetical protein